MNPHGQSFGVFALLTTALLTTVVLLVATMVAWRLGVNPTIACGFAGAFCLHLGIRPTGTQIGSALIIGLGYSLSYRLLGGQFGDDRIAMLASIGAFAGLGSITMLAYQALWFKTEPDIQAVKDASVLPLFLAGAGLAATFTQNLWPKTFDLYLYAFDCSLGISPGSMVDAWWKPMPVLATFCTGTYALFLVFPPLFRAWAVHRGISREPSVLRSFAIAGVLCFILQQCCPASGPRHLFSDNFPNHLLPLSELSVGMTAVAGARNAIPSMHATWALLIWWSTWRLGWWARTVATLFVILTFISALGAGEHYFADLVVAVPLTLSVEGLCRRGHVAAGLGFGLTLAWLILLRSGFLAPAPAIGWLLIALTVMICVVCQIPLYRGKHTEEGLALSSRLSAMTGARLVSRTR